MRRFHSYGPVDCRYHFCVERSELVESCLNQLVGVPKEGGHYFTIWAPQQTGKTWLMREVTQEIAQRYSDQFAVFNVSFGNLRGLDDAPNLQGDQIKFPQALGGILKAALQNRYALDRSSRSLSSLRLAAKRSGTSLRC